MKKIFSFILAVFLSFLLLGCTEKPSKYVPYNQPYTKWETADKSVTMYISDDEYGYGYLQSADDTIQVYFEFYLDVRLLIFNSKDFNSNSTNEPIECWDIQCYKSKVEATIHEGCDSMLYKPGDKIILNKTEDGISKEDIPCLPNLCG